MSRTDQTQGEHSRQGYSVSKGDKATRCVRCRLEVGTTNRSIKERSSYHLRALAQPLALGFVCFFHNHRHSLTQPPLSVTHPEHPVIFQPSLFLTSVSSQRPNVPLYLPRTSLPGMWLPFRYMSASVSFYDLFSGQTALCHLLHGTCWLGKFW